MSWRRLDDLPGGRRSKFAIVGVWLIVLFAIGPLAGKFEDAQENDPADYLPANAESVEAIEELEEFPSGDIANAITVFYRDGGLEAADKAVDRGGPRRRSTPTRARASARPARRSSPRTAPRRC